MRDSGMCEKCAEIDKRIEHYKWLATRVNDPPASKGIEEVIKQCEAEKRALHREANS